MVSTTAWAPTAVEAPAVANLDKLVYDDRSLTVIRWRRWLASPTVVAVAAGPREAPVALAVVEPAPGRRWWLGLYRLAVHPDHRRRGLATQIAAVLGERHGLRLRLCETNRGGLEWATAVGFRVQGVDRGGFGDLDAVTLERPATSARSRGDDGG